MHSKLPIVAPSDETGEQGLRLVEAAIAKAGHIFRPTVKRDFGIDGQVEIVMSLMPVSAEAARGAVLRMGGQRKDTSHFTIAGRPGAPRTVIVERRAPRRVPLLRPTTASAGYRGRI